MYMYNDKSNQYEFMVYSWENAKLLLIKENVVEDMMFYDKDNIPDDIFEKLGKVVNHSLFQPDDIKRVSVAASGICQWVHAVYKYAHIHRNMQPRLRNLFEQEEKFSQVLNKLSDYFRIYVKFQHYHSSFIFTMHPKYRMTLKKTKHSSMKKYLKHTSCKYTVFLPAKSTCTIIMLTGIDL